MVTSLLPLKLKHAISPSVPTAPSSILGAEALRRVLDNRDAVALSDFEQRVEIHGVAEDVDRQQCANASAGDLTVQRSVAPPAVPREIFDHPVRVHLPGVRLGVDEDRMSADVSDRVGGRDKRQTGNQDLVVWPHTRHQQRDVKGRRAVDGGHRVRDPDGLSQRPLEAVDEGPDRRDPPRIQALLHVGPLVARNRRLAERDERWFQRDIMGSESGAHQFRYLGAFRSAMAPAITSPATSAIPSGTVRVISKPSCSLIRVKHTR